MPGLQTLLHQSPRQFGQDSDLWTLEMLAEVSLAQGIISQQVSRETIRRALGRLGVQWKRAKKWRTSPDPRYRGEKRNRDRLVRLRQAHPDWMLVWEDECWFSRFAQPNLKAWTLADQPVRLHQPEPDKGDPEAKAVACYGALEEESAQVWLRFSPGQPNSTHTLAFLEYLREVAAGRGRGCWCSSGTMPVGIRANWSSSGSGRITGR